MLLSILIVNYNGMRFLHDCLSSIEEHVHCKHEVIIVDNASVDGSVDFIRHNFPWVKLIASQINTGFTGGNNLAASSASGDLLLLLNNDTVLLSDIQPALDSIREVKVGIVGAHLQYGDTRNQPSAGYAHTPLRLILSWIGLSNFKLLPSVFRRVETSLDFYANDKSDLDWVSGAFLLTPRSLWEKLAGLDERYFMYVEDVDYCRRVKEAGYSINYVANVDVCHYEGAGRAWIGEAALMRTMTSYVLYLRKYYGDVVILATIFSLGLVMFSRALAFQVANMLSPSQVLREKKTAYFKAARFLLKCS